MRKIAKLPRLGIQPQQIIRFDSQRYGQNLTHPTTKKGAQFSRSIMAKHAAILAMSAAEANTVCLSTNQIGLQSKAIAIHQHIKANKTNEQIEWIDSAYNDAQQYDIYHKPVVLEGKKIVEIQEESISYPFIVCKTKRYNEIEVAFLDKDFVKREMTLTGQPAWVFQQSSSQLEGEILLDWRVNCGKIWLKQQIAKFFPKTASVIEEYAADLGKTFKQYPQLLRLPQHYKIMQQDYSKEELDLCKMKEQVLPFESDFYRRLLKHYRRQMAALEEKIDKGFAEPFQWSESTKPNSKIIDK